MLLFEFMSDYKNDFVIKVWNETYSTEDIPNKFLNCSVQNIIVSPDKLIVIIDPWPIFRGE